MMYVRELDFQHLVTSRNFHVLVIFYNSNTFLIRFCKKNVQLRDDLNLVKYCQKTQKAQLSIMIHTGQKDLSTTKNYTKQRSFSSSYYIQSKSKLILTSWACCPPKLQTLCTVNRADILQTVVIQITAQYNDICDWLSFRSTI